MFPGLKESPRSCSIATMIVYGSKLLQISCTSQTQVRSLHGAIPDDLDLWRSLTLRIREMCIFGCIVALVREIYCTFGNAPLQSDCVHTRTIKARHLSSRKLNLRALSTCYSKLYANCHFCSTFVQNGIVISQMAVQNCLLSIDLRSTYCSMLSE